jgi:hypothetical protein
MRGPSSVITTLLAVCGALTLTPSDAEARKAKKLELGVGVLGFVNGSFLTKLSEGNKLTGINDETGNGKLYAIPYPGFLGVGGGGGITANVMYKGAIGLQLDVLYSVERSEGQVNVQTDEGGTIPFDIELSQGAFHIPLLVKAAIPLRSVRPHLLVGPEFVIPVDSATTLSPAVKDAKYGAFADSYVALGVGFGFDFLIPGEEDLRIPLQIRGAINFEDSDNITDRVRGLSAVGAPLPYESLSTAWQYQAFIMLGFTWNQAIS